MGDLSDRDLLARYSSGGEEEPFRDLMARHCKMVFATAVRSLGDRGLAEEVVQNVFSALAAKADRLAEIGSLPGWLYRCARLEVAMVVRRERRRRNREAVAAERDAVARSGVDAGMSEALDEAMDALPASDQRLVVMRFYEGLTVGELARRLDISEATARKRVERAVGRLRKGVVAAGGVLGIGPVGAADFIVGGTEMSAGLVERFEVAAPVAGAGAASTAAVTAGILASAAGFAALYVGVVLMVEPGAWRRPDRGDQVAAAQVEEPGARALAVDDLEGIYALGGDAREVALADLEAYLSTVEDRPYLRRLFLRWTRLEAERAAKVASNLVGERENVFLETARGAIRRWAEKEPAEATAWALERDAARRHYEDELGNAINEEVALALAEADAERAFAFLQEVQVTTGTMFFAVSDGVARRGYDLDETVKWLDALATRSARDIVFEIEHTEGEVNFPHVLPEAGIRAVDRERGVVVYPLEVGARKWQLGEALLRRHLPGQADAVVEILVEIGVRKAEWRVLETLMNSDPVAGLEWFLARREAMPPTTGRKVLGWLFEDSAKVDMALVAAFWAGERRGGAGEAEVAEKIRQRGLEDAFLLELSVLGRESLWDAGLALVGGHSSRADHPLRAPATGPVHGQSPVSPDPH